MIRGPPDVVLWSLKAINPERGTGCIYRTARDPLHHRVRFSHVMPTPTPSPPLAVDAPYTGLRCPFDVPNPREVPPDCLSQPVSLWTGPMAKPALSAFLVGYPIRGVKVPTTHLGNDSPENSFLVAPPRGPLRPPSFLQGCPPPNPDRSSPPPRAPRDPCVLLLPPRMSLAAEPGIRTAELDRNIETRKVVVGGRSPPIRRGGGGRSDPPYRYSIFLSNPERPPLPSPPGPCDPPLQDGPRGRQRRRAPGPLPTGGFRRPLGTPRSFLPSPTPPFGLGGGRGGGSGGLGDRRGVVAPPACTRAMTSIVRWLPAHVLLLLQHPTITLIRTKVYPPPPGSVGTP